MEKEKMGRREMFKQLLIVALIPTSVKAVEKLGGHHLQMPGILQRFAWWLQSTFGSNAPPIQPR